MKDQLLERLAPHGQEHLLAFWDDLDDAGRTKLAAQIHSVDFVLVAGLAKGDAVGPDWVELSRKAKPPPAYRLGDPTRESQREKARELGEAALQSGRVGMILVAGGLGTRLGFDHPKGLFPIGPVSQRTLFQMLFERLLAVGNKYRTCIPLYLMTSLATHDETATYLTQCGRFGLPEQDLRLFRQGAMPAVDAASGRLLLAQKDELFLGPDGHGGMLAAFNSPVGWTSGPSAPSPGRTGGPSYNSSEESCLADARQRGIEYLFYGQVDNPLTQVCDPELIGFHILAESEMTTQVVQKSTPLEKVGNVVSVDGQVRIIEYSDLPREAAERVGPDGQPLLWAGNIAVHVFNVSFLERMAGQADALPFHLAKKKTPFVDPASGQLVDPAEPNSLKFEKFIFDLLPFAKNAIAVEAAKAEAFAPVKNANEELVDTPATAQALLMARHAALLRAYGTRFADDVPIELGPRFEVDDIDQLTLLALPHMYISQPMYFA